VKTRDEIVDAVQGAQREGAAYWSAFGPDVFFQKIGESWSPSETVRHLSKSIRAVVKGLTMPRLMLRLSFGKPRRPSVTYDDLRTRYLGLLEAGGRAGRFAPSPETTSDRSTILERLAQANDHLQKAIARWSDADLDRYQLPHPLLGKLTIREMLFFTVYHQHHHMNVTSRRRAEAGPPA
jgi:hypothetical protein